MTRPHHSPVTPTNWTLEDDFSDVPQRNALLLEDAAHLVVERVTREARLRSLVKSPGFAHKTPAAARLWQWCDDSGATMRELDEHGVTCRGGRGRERASRSELGAVGGSGPTVANVARLRALVSTLTAGSDQLRDENTMLRRAVDRARAEADLAGASPVARGESSEAAGADGAAADQETLQRVRRERDTLKNDLGVAQRGLFSAKEQLRVMINKDDEHKKEAAKLTKERVFQAEENGRLAKELDALKTSVDRGLLRPARDGPLRGHPEGIAEARVESSACGGRGGGHALAAPGGLLRRATPSAAP